ncbi:unnamed protein product [Adineta steineri]|uniref:Uncharacterized protein n=1 Tax=Adineta steineri TaxID=433720 RepID=A0A814JKY6_9BILA|nr:unnamed protein product [Adineta steineri]CAF1102426.1 unnamed protein product [Adineta steineri]
MYSYSSYFLEKLRFHHPEQNFRTVSITIKVYLVIKVDLDSVAGSGGFYLVHILDIIHALCGYCSESNVGLAHYTPYISTKSDTNLRQTYSNNFGNTQLGVGPQGIDRFILNIMFKPFITRLIMMKKYLMSSKNVALYVIFSSLLDPEKNLKIFQQQELNAKLKSKGAHTFARHDATSRSGKGTLLNRDSSEDADFDRHGSTTL